MYSLFLIKRCVGFAGVSQPFEQELSRREAWEKVATAAAFTTTASGLVLPNQASFAVEDLPKVPSIRLGESGLEVSRTIQGYWQLAGGHGRYQEADAIANMEAHLNAGITTMDTADICEL